jgi:hypothetical protein
MDIAMHTKQNTCRPRPFKASIRSAAVVSALGAVLLGSAPPAVLADGGGLEQKATVYLWGAGIDSTTAGGSEADVSFDQLINNLNMTFMGAYEARKGPWSGGLDIVYLNVGADGDGKVPVRGPAGRSAGIDVTADVKTRGWVIDAYAGRNLVQTDRLELDALIGLRYLELRLDFKLDLGVGRFQTARDSTASAVVWDGVAGVKGRVLLDNGWSLPYRFDIGAGDSDLTWQANAGVAYSWDRAEVALTYRHMAWEFGSGGLDDTAFSGPQLAASFRF